MRGILSLAAASAIPQTTATGTPFPDEDTARRLIEDVDLRQAAQHTRD